jgi:hypothetical protein
MKVYVIFAVYCELRYIVTSQPNFYKCFNKGPKLQSGVILGTSRAIFSFWEHNKLQLFGKWIDVFMFFMLLVMLASVEKSFNKLKIIILQEKFDRPDEAELNLMPCLLYSKK